MKFQSSYESKKWAKIESGTKATIEKIKQGTATPEEINALGSAMKEYSNLASSLFDLAAQSIEASAEERIKLIELHREKMDKDPLTEDQIQKLMALSLEKSWAEQGLEVASMLEESLMSEFSAVQSKLDQLIGKNEEQAEEDPQVVQDKQEQKSSRTKVDSILSLVTDTKNEISNEVKDLLSQINSNATIANDRLTTMANETAVEQQSQPTDSEHLIDERLDRVIGMVDQQQPRFDTITDKIDKLIGMVSESSTVEGDQTSIINQSVKSDSPQSVEQERKDDQLRDNVEEAAEQQTSLFNKLLQFIGLRRRNKEKDEESKASAWWRKFKGYFGDKWGAVKAGGIGLMAGLGVAAAKYFGMKLLDSDTWKKINEYFSTHSLKDMTKDAWAYLEDQGKSLMSWLSKQFSDFFDPSISKKQYSDAKAQARTQASTSMSIANDPTKSDSQRKNAGRNATYGNNKAKNIPQIEERNEKYGFSYWLNKILGRPDTSTTTNLSLGGNGPTFNSTSTVNDNASYNPSSLQNIKFEGNTKSMDSSNPEYKLQPSEQQTPTAEDGSRPALGSNSRSQPMGLGSFGYSSGVDPLLGMMNLGILT